MSKTVGNIVIFVLLLSMVSNGAINVQMVVSTVVSLAKGLANSIPTEQQYKVPPTQGNPPAVR